jgi:hypothetical protein
MIECEYLQWIFTDESAIAREACNLDESKSVLLGTINRLDNVMRAYGPEWIPSARELRYASSDGTRESRLDEFRSRLISACCRRKPQQCNYMWR